ncbi:MAG: serine hydrolase domain-containing protein [Sphingopyxis sp.]
MNIDSQLEHAITASGIAGAVAAIGHAGGVRYQRAFGVRDSVSQAPMLDDTVFQIASMTKAIVSVGAMQLVEQGRVQLDDPVGAILPELASPQVLDGFDNAGAPRLRPAARAITLRHLLTHTSGLGYTFVSADLMRAVGPDGPPQGSLAAIRLPLLFDPGDRWEYGVGTDWVGQLVERVAGQGLGDYLRQHILQPLAMVDTAFRSAATMPANTASVHVRLPDGGIMPVPINLGGGEYDNGGGGLSSTMGDYMRFLRMVLNQGTLDGACVLSPASIAEMSRNQIGALAAGRMGSAIPTAAAPYDPFPGMDCGWGLGFLINPVDGPHGRAAGSMAWAGIFNSYYWVDPARDVIGLFLSQLAPFGDPAVLNAYAALEQMAYAGPALS